MTTSGITIDPAAIQGFVEKAILDGISESQRDDIITQAVQNLLVKKESGSFSTRKSTSMLEDAFSSDIHTAAYTVVRETIENNPEVQDRIKAIISPTIAEIAKGNYDGLPEIIGAAVGQAVSDWLRNRAL